MSKEMTENNTPEAIEFEAERWLVGPGARFELDETGRVWKAYLQGTDVTDVGLADLAGQTNLEVLRLAGTGVTDAGLVHLSDGLELLPRQRHRSR